MERRCKYCNKVLPDELHGSRKFCPDKSPDGSFLIGDSICKTRFNNKKIKDRDADMAMFVKMHKTMGLKLGTLLRQGRKFISAEELESVGIFTTTPLGIVRLDEGPTGLVYRNYALKTIERNKFEIIRYDHRKLRNLFS